MIPWNFSMSTIRKWSKQQRTIRTCRCSHLLARGPCARTRPPTRWRRWQDVCAGRPTKARLKTETERPATYGSTALHDTMGFAPPTEPDTRPWRGRWCIASVCPPSAGRRRGWGSLGETWSRLVASVAVPLAPPARQPRTGLGSSVRHRFAPGNVPVVSQRDWTLKTTRHEFSRSLTCPVRCQTNQINKLWAYDSYTR